MYLVKPLSVTKVDDILIYFKKEYENDQIEKEILFSNARNISNENHVISMKISPEDKQELKNDIKLETPINIISEDKQELKNDIKLETPINIISEKI